MPGCDVQPCMLQMVAGLWEGEEPSWRGMRRPSKKKVEKTDTTAEDGDEVAVDTGITGEQQPALNESTEATAKVDAAAGPGGRKWKVAFDAFENASMAAIRLRCIANEQGKQEKLAERLHDAKMRQLDAGDKLKRRKKTFGAARRTYEAIIALLQTQHKAEWHRCRAAEAERDAAQADLRLCELE